DVLEGRPAEPAEMVLVEAHAHHTAPPRDLRHRLIRHLPVAGHDRARVAVRGHDRSPPEGERVGHRLVGHVAQVEDHLLAAHGLRRTGCAASVRRGPTPYIAWRRPAPPRRRPGMTG